MKAGRWLIGLGAVLFAALAGGYVMRVPLASLAAEAWLAARGFSAAQVDVASLEADGAEIAGLELGPGLPSTGRVTVGYRLVGFGGIEVHSVRVEGLRVQADLSDPAPLKRLDALLPQGAAAPGGAAGPVIHIDAASLLLTTPAGEIDVGLDATADLSRRPAHATLDAVGRTPYGRVSLTAAVDDPLGTPVAKIDGKAAVDLAALPDDTPLAEAFDAGTADLALSGTVALPSPDDAAKRRWLTRDGTLTATLHLRGASAPSYVQGVDASARLRLRSGNGRLRLDLAEPATVAGNLLADLPVDRIQEVSLGVGLGPQDGPARPAKATLTGSLANGRVSARLTGDAVWVPGRPFESPLPVSADLNARGIAAGAVRLSMLDWKPTGTTGDGRASLAGPLHTHLAPGDGQQAVEIAGRLGVAGTPSSGRLRLAGGTVRLFGAELSVRELAADVPWPFVAGGDRAVLSATVVDGRSPGRFAPLAVSANVTPAGDGMALDGEIAAAGGAVRIPAAGRYAPGQSRLSLGPTTLVFGGNGLRPASLGGALDAIGRTSGSVEAAARFYITGDTVDGAAELTLRDLTVETDDLLIEKMNGTVRLDGLLPPRTAAVQTVTADRIVAGLPLKDVAVSFRLRRGATGTVADIRRAGGGFAGGTVRIEDTQIDPSSARQAVDIRIDGIDLQTLLKEWAMDGLAGTGRLSGVIPVSIGPEGAAIRNGVLRAGENGTLSVNWGKARETLLKQNENVALMVRTLEDFHYRELKVGLTRPPDGSLALKLTLEGHNPAVKDGYPFRFNISFSGDLEEILAAVREGRRLGGTLLKGGFDFAR